MYVPYPCRIRSYGFMEQMPSYMRHTLVGAEFIPRTAAGYPYTCGSVYFCVFRLLEISAGFGGKKLAE